MEAKHLLIIPKAISGEEYIDEDQTKNANNKVDILYNFWLGRQDSIRMQHVAPGNMRLFTESCVV
jgi:hypothetical protein